MADSSSAWWSEPGFWLWLGTNGLHVSVYWSLALVLACFDLHPSSSVLTPYKVQPASHRPLSPSLWRKVVARVLVNQLVVGTVLTVASYPWVMRGRLDFDINTPPTITRIAREVAGCALIQELGFYCGHRLCHALPLVYRHIHKMHHELSAPVGGSAMYCHWLEQALVNLLPVGAGPALLGCHVWSVYVWVALATAVTVVQHSGYHLPLLPSPEFHDWHHARPSDGNYGSIGLLDWLHGTDRPFRRHCPYASHHRPLLGLTPVPRLPPPPPTKRAPEGSQGS